MSEAHACAEAPGAARVLGKPYVCDSVRKLLHNHLPGSIGRGIVDDQDFVKSPSLAQKRFQTLREQFFAVIAWYDCTDSHFYGLT
jgi:hypothetical protein